MFRTLLAIWIGKTILFLTRLFKTGGGSAAPGHYTLKIQPDLVKIFASQIPQNIVITGTNGKTTTARMLNHLVKAQNLKVIRNSTGSNLERGLASTLISHSNWLGKIQNVDLGIWELDEAAFNKSVFQLKPQIIVFLNAFRDQLDRYGEVDSVVSKWRESLEKVDWNPIVLINGNDQNTAGLNSIENIEPQIFKVKGNYQFGENDKHFDYDLVKGDIEASDVKTNGLDGTSFKLSIINPSTSLRTGDQVSINLPIPGIYHIFDFLAAFSAYYHLNLPINKVDENLKGYSPAFGRVEKLQLGENEAYIFLIKNPAGATLVFETIAPEIRKCDRLLMALNDNFADGRDVSWIWDAGFEELRIGESENQKVRKSPTTSLRGVQPTWQSLSIMDSRLHGNDNTVICSGTRAFDLANRLKYAGFEAGEIIIEEDMEAAFKIVQKDLEGRLFILPTYTALLELQKILAEHGHKKHYWKE